MQDQDKPFVLYRRSRWNFTIVPRGPRGWALLAGWMALLVPPTIALVHYAEAYEGRPQFDVAVALFLIATLVWSLAMIAWMKARAEVVDLDEMLRLKREAQRKPRRGR